MPAKRIALIGCPGAGKSTFSHKLAAKTKLPLFHLDQMFWQHGWTKPEKGMWHATHLNLISKDEWIIDGNYQNTLEPRLARADWVIFFDFSTHQSMWGITKRIWRNYGHTRPDMAPGCPERLDFPFFRYVLNFHRTDRPQILAILANLPPETRVDIVTTHAQADALLGTL